MVEQWEHMTMRTDIYDLSSKEPGKTELIRADGSVETLEGSSISGSLEVMNRLGRDGWRMVHAERNPYNNGHGLQRTYWLNRPLP